MTISDLYISLFGKGAIKDGNVIDMAEHGRVGGVSTGEAYKQVSDIVANSLVPSTYDTVEINYTDATKATISSVVYKNGATTVSTLTPTFDSTKDVWGKT